MKRSAYLIFLLNIVLVASLKNYQEGVSNISIINNNQLIQSSNNLDQTGEIKINYCKDKNCLVCETNLNIKENVANKYSDICTKCKENFTLTNGKCYSKIKNKI